VATDGKKTYNKGFFRGFLASHQKTLGETLDGVATAVKGLKDQTQGGALELLNVLGDGIDVDVLAYFRPSVVEFNQEIAWDVDIALFNPVDHPLGQVEDGVLVWLHRSCCVDDERERGVDDVSADGDGAGHAVAGDAPTVVARTVGVGRTGAALTQARLGWQKSGQSFDVGDADLLHDAQLAGLWVLDSI